MNSKNHIPFNRPPLVGNELAYLTEALAGRKFAGDGPFTTRCHDWLKSHLNGKQALLTHSCTAALEMTTLLTDLRPGDEVIMPSFAFVSTANAVALRGATPVFVDIRGDTLNIDEKKIEAAITTKTKAIMLIHYAGVAAEMDVINSIGAAHKIPVIEDAAQGLLASYRGKPLGTLGLLGALSFHETKNIVSGEGGALIINDPKLKERAEIIREKGTNRSQFFRGQIDKYTWQELGSSYLPSDLLAAVLLAQFEQAKASTTERLGNWEHYRKGLNDLIRRGMIERPIVPEHCEHNGHIFFFLTRSLAERTKLIEHMKAKQISPTYHYIPLHSAPAGIKYGRTAGKLTTTDDCADRLLRLPLWAGISKVELDRVLEAVNEFYSS